MVALRSKVETIGTFIDDYQKPIPSIIYSTNKAIEELKRLNNTEAVEVARRVLDLCDIASGLGYDWQQQKQNDPLSRPGTRAKDDDIDNTLSQLLQTIEAYADLKGDGEPTRLAEELRDELFPSGVYPITSQPFGQQHDSVNTVVDRLDGKFSRHVQVLNLGPIVDQLEELNEEFGEMLDTVGEQVSYDEVEAARAEARDAFHKLLAKIMYDYADDMEKFNRVTAGLRDQNARMRRSLQRNGVMPDVDPETGEPIEEGASGENDGGSGNSDQVEETDGSGNTETDGSPDENDGESESSGSGGGTAN